MFRVLRLVGLVGEDGSVDQGTAAPPPTLHKEAYDLLGHGGVYASEEIKEREPEPLPNGIYGVGIACLISDVEHAFVSKQPLRTRLTRAFIGVIVIVFLMSLQFFLIERCQTLVVPGSVKTIRDTYNAYQRQMYTQVTVDGVHVRGIKGFFNTTQFAYLPEDLKSNVCRIPLSHPWFTSGILLIWCITCVSDVRESVYVMGCLLCLQRREISKSLVKQPDQKGTFVVEGLPLWLKLPCALIMFSRALVVVKLCIIGCRWLIATVGFCDLLLNAVALEFVLALRSLLYEAVLPRRIQEVPSQILIPPMIAVEPPTPSIFFGMFLSLIGCIVWVWIYMWYLQRVLPNYNWDVHAACESYLEDVMKVEF